jgi:hypothetical protein
VCLIMPILVLTFTYIQLHVNFGTLMLSLSLSRPSKDSCSSLYSAVLEIHNSYRHPTRDFKRSRDLYMLFNAPAIICPRRCRASSPMHPLALA